MTKPEREAAARVAEREAVIEAARTTEIDTSLYEFLLAGYHQAAAEARTVIETEREYGVG